MTFDHLDDPAGFTPDDDFRAETRRNGRRRRTRRRLAIASGSVLSSLAVLVTAVSGYGLWRTKQIDRVEVEFAAPPADLDGPPFNILLIGSDRRPDADPQRPDPEPMESYADTIVVVRVDPAGRRVTLLALPRDLVVGTGDGGTTDRLAAEHLADGPRSLVETVESQLGIPLSAYVEVGFPGLEAIVDQVGGIDVAVAEPVRDRASGLYLDASPCSGIDGPTMLALVRSRHLEVLRPEGEWIEDPTGDLGRQQRQRAVLVAVLPQLSELINGVGGIDAALSIAADYLTIDRRLEAATMAALARWATTGPAPVVDEVVLPVAGAMLDQSAILALASGADAAVARMGGSLPAAATVAADPLLSGGGGPVADMPGGDAVISVCP